MKDLKFSEATPAQFREFWEGAGWQIQPKGGLWACRGTLMQIVWVTTHGMVQLFDHLGGSVLVDRPTTFGEALELANKIADALGGWA